MWLWPSSNFQSSCLSLPGAEIRGVSCHGHLENISKPFVQIHKLKFQGVLMDLTLDITLVPRGEDLTCPREQRLRPDCAPSAPSALQCDNALGQQACLIVRGSSLCQAPEVSGCWEIGNDSQAKPEMESSASNHQFNLCLPERMRLNSVTLLGAGEKAACQPSVLSLAWLSSALMDVGSKSIVGVAVSTGGAECEVTR